MTSISSFNPYGDDFYTRPYNPADGALQDPYYLAEMSYFNQLMDSGEKSLLQFNTSLGTNPDTGKSYNLLDPYDQVSYINNSFTSLYTSIASSYKKIQG